MKKKKFDDKIISIDYDDDQKNYDEFSTFLQEHTTRVKNKDANNIFEMGEILLTEINQKKYINEKKKDAMIDYITSKTDKYFKPYLKELDIKDVEEIYVETKNKNKPFFIKLFEWLFN